MSEKLIIWTRADGGLGLFAPAPEFVARFDGEDAALADIQPRVVPPGATDVTIVRRADLNGNELDDWHHSDPAENAAVIVAGKIEIDMPRARALHAKRIAAAWAAETARLKVAERGARLAGNSAQADQHAATVTALEALDLSGLATQIADATNPTALKASWPAQVPR